MGLLAVYDTEPNAPIEYLANWLLNYSQIQKQLAIVTAALEEANDQTKEKEVKVKVKVQDCGPGTYVKTDAE